MKKHLIFIVAMGFCSLGFSQPKPYVEWVNIPAGTFTMGSPVGEQYREEDETQHKVTLSAFKMGKYEVTFDQYDAFCNATGNPKPDDRGWGRGKRPVINVSWDDATAFAKWMGCRLPTEAQWEYACRAGSTTAYNTGNDLSGDQANFDNWGPSGQGTSDRTLPVGSFSPNPWGIYDMHGNVAEWCIDWKGDYPGITQTNPQGPTTGSDHLIRGGSWCMLPYICRSANRNDIIQRPLKSGSIIGFRLVASK